MSAEEVLLAAVPVARPLAVHTHLPVPKLFAVALAAQQVGRREGNGLPAGEMKRVPVFRCVAVQAPPTLGAMLQDDVLVHLGQLPAPAVDGKARVTPGAGENPLAERRGRNLDFLGLTCSRCR